MTFGGGKKTKDKVRDNVEQAFDRVHKVADVLTAPIAPIDGLVHGVARGVSNWLLDRHPAEPNKGSSRNGGGGQTFSNEGNTGLGQGNVASGGLSVGNDNQVGSPRKKLPAGKGSSVDASEDDEEDSGGSDIGGGVQKFRNEGNTGIGQGNVGSGGLKVGNGNRVARRR